MQQLQANLRRRIETLVAWRQGGKTRLEVAISSNDAATFRLISQCQGVLPRLSLHQRITLLGNGVHDLLATDRHQQLRMICASGIPPLTSWLEAALEAGARGCIMVLREYGLGFPTPAERRRMTDRLPALRALIEVRAPHACIIGGADRGPGTHRRVAVPSTHDHTEGGHTRQRNGWTASCRRPSPRLRHALGCPDCIRQAIPVRPVWDAVRSAGTAAATGRDPLASAAGTAPVNNGQATASAHPGAASAGVQAPTAAPTTATGPAATPHPTGARDVSEEEQASVARTVTAVKSEAGADRHRRSRGPRHAHGRRCQRRSTGRCQG